MKQRNKKFTSKVDRKKLVITENWDDPVTKKR
jgi:hypothetical protein